VARATAAARPTFRAAPVRVRVPATSANLGPAFDAAGLALALHDDVVARVADGGLTIDVAGEGADRLPRGERHLVVKAMRAAFRLMGGQPRGLELVCANRIPHGRGLGSSAAAIVAGIAAARALVVGGDERLDDGAALDLAHRMEGHPDNVAAAWSGGLTVAWSDSAEAAGAVRHEPGGWLRPVAFVPTTQLKTAKARALLPVEVPLAAAARAAGRAALLPTALTVAPDLLLAATSDTLHQEYRRAAYPRSRALVDALRGQGLAAVVSGAGPTVLVLARDDDEAAAAVARAPRWFTPHRLDVDRGGVEVVPLPG
jgi:homoserine kinase